MSGLQPLHSQCHGEADRGLAAKLLQWEGPVFWCSYGPTYLRVYYGLGRSTCGPNYLPCWVLDPVIGNLGPRSDDPGTTLKC